MPSSCGAVAWALLEWFEVKRPLVCGAAVSTSCASRWSQSSLFHFTSRNLSIAFWPPLPMQPFRRTGSKPTTRWVFDKLHDPCGRPTLVSPSCWQFKMIHLLKLHGHSVKGFKWVVLYENATSRMLTSKIQNVIWCQSDQLWFVHTFLILVCCTIATRKGLFYKACDEDMHNLLLVLTLLKIISRYQW